MPTKGRDLIESFVPQLGHEPHVPLDFRAKRSHACRAKYAAAKVAMEMARMSCIKLPSADESNADLIGHQRAKVSQDRHVSEGKGGPAPAVGFAADHGQRRGTLRAEREEDHDRQGHR